MSNLKSEDKDLPTISIVMPCWNCVDYIERTIRSVVEQDYPKIELFIKDGGSEDGTVEIIKHYAKKYPKIVKWISNKDKGQTDAINYGMKQVKGDILTYLNADDIYKRGTLKKIAEFFIKNPNKMWVIGKADIIDNDDKEIRGWITAYKNFWLQNYSYSTLLILNYISQMSVFWRKEVYQKIGQFDVNQKYAMDYEYWLRIGENYKPGLIRDYLASFRIVPTSKSSTGFLKQFKEDYDISTKHTTNQLILSLHYLHYQLIIAMYSIMKLLNSFKWVTS